MAADLNGLAPDFRARVTDLLRGCIDAKVEMRPYFTLRDSFDQARLWRQSRSREQIAAKIAELRSAGADFLASCIDSVGPQNGDPVTNAIPGLSWHQWGEAADCFWVVDNTAEWSTQKKINGVNGYHTYADQAAALGLTPGGWWRSLKDWPHVQLRAESSPLGMFALPEIDRRMRERFDA